jgi:Astacin (Peptidase family M12A)
MNSIDAKPHCSTPPQKPISLPASMPANRARAIMVGSSKWVNGTVLRYAFFGPEPNPAWAPANDAQKEVVRESFAAWHDLPLGLSFEEVEDLSEAEVRIAFDQSDGSWSYIGRDILTIGTSESTMNFGWPLDTPYGHTTALHEIGHTLGMPHEHQSPFSGIVWDEAAVISYFSGPPNNWPPDTIQSNVLAKLSAHQVEGSKWDWKSIMEYEFGPGLILEPAEFVSGIQPPGTISELDVEWMQSWYPAGEAQPQSLAPLATASLPTGPQAQGDFAISPPASRKYEIGTFGAADTVLVLFEQVDGELRYVAGDDDGGEERNARLEAKLFQGREYVLRARVNWAGEADRTAVMYW